MTVLFDTVSSETLESRQRQGRHLHRRRWRSWGLTHHTLSSINPSPPSPSSGPSTQGMSPLSLLPPHRIEYRVPTNKQTLAAYLRYTTFRSCWRWPSSPSVTCLALPNLNMASPRGLLMSRHLIGTRLSNCCYCTYMHLHLHLAPSVACIGNASIILLSAPLRPIHTTCTAPQDRSRMKHKTCTIVIVSPRGIPRELGRRERSAHHSFPSHQPPISRTIAGQWTDNCFCSCPGA